MVQRLLTHLMMCVLVALIATASLTNALAHLPVPAAAASADAFDGHAHARETRTGEKSLAHHAFADHEHMSFLPMASATQRGGARAFAQVSRGLPPSGQSLNAPQPPPRG